jgi:hypothetical protein
MACHENIITRTISPYVISTNPVVWFPVLVGYSNDKDMIIFHGVYQSEHLRVFLPDMP